MCKKGRKNELQDGVKRTKIPQTTAPIRACMSKLHLADQYALHTRNKTIFPDQKATSTFNPTVRTTPLTPLAANQIHTILPPTLDIMPITMSTTTTHGRQALADQVVAQAAISRTSDRHGKAIALSPLTMCPPTTAYIPILTRTSHPSTSHLI